MRASVFSLAFALAVAAVLAISGPARADDLFTVNGIHVDASAASASAAQLTATAQGRPKAWSALFRRITRQQDWGRQPNLDDAALQRIIKTAFPRNERRSTTRYVADMTYQFSPDGVQRALQGVGIAFALFQAKKILVIPFAPGYARNTAWGAALASPRFAAAVVPFALPGGDALDNSALGGLGFDSASWADVEPAASRIHASEAVLVLAAPTPGHLTVTLRRIGQGEIPTKSSIDVPLLPGGPATTYPAAADAAMRGIEEMWKNKAAVDFSQTGRLTADLRVSTLSQWSSLQTQLATVPNVSGITVQAMDIGEARVSIAYLGSVDQLKDAMAAQGLMLSKSGGEWTVVPGAPVPPPPQPQP
jgi:hypothetical protein